MTREEAINILRETHDNALFSVRTALETLAPELAESEDERIMDDAIQIIRASRLRCAEYGTEADKHLKAIAYLEKLKEQKHYWKPTETDVALFNKAVTTNKTLTPAERAQLDIIRSKFGCCRAVNCSGIVQEEQKPILEVFGFKVGDKVRLKDGDGRTHIIKKFERIEGLHGPDFYHVEFEDNSARDGIYPGEEYPNGYYTQMEKFEEERKPEEKSINWTELTWKDINELEGIINNVHYEFRNGIGQESFGKEVLERFREYKGDEYLDEIEEKPEDVTGIIHNAISEVCHTGDPKGFAEMNQTVFKVAQRVAEMCQKPAEWAELQSEFENIDESFEDGKKEVISNPEKYGLCKPVEWNNATINGEPVLTENQSVDIPLAEWNEEDERMILETIRVLESGRERYIDESGHLPSWHIVITWLKSLPKRFSPQPKQEWSEEDRNNLNRIAAILVEGSNVQNWWRTERLITKEEMRKLTDWLKSLKPSWKPSEEELRTLDIVISDYRHACTKGSDKKAEVLKPLLEQLRKL